MENLNSGLQNIRSTFFVHHAPMKIELFVSLWKKSYFLFHRFLKQVANVSCYSLDQTIVKKNLTYFALE